MAPSNENSTTSPSAVKLQTMQPATPQTMTLDPSQTASPAQAEESQKQEVRMRGGDRGGMCPGRFCFIIPCPIPCDFCII